MFFGSLLLSMTNCGKKIDSQVVKAIQTFDGLSLKKEQIEILEIRELGDTIVAEIRVNTAVRLVKEKSKWRIAEIRLADRKWENADHILMLLEKQRKEATRIRLEELNQGVHRYIESEGKVPSVRTSRELVDSLYPEFVDNLVCLDAWSNPLIYKALSIREYRLISVGADGIQGTSDDISLEKQY